jgi:hypothetical protein
MIALLGRSALYFNREEFFERSGEHYRKLDWPEAKLRSARRESP